MKNKKDWKSIREFDRQYEYDGKDLGVVCKGETTVFKVWSPLAEKIELRLYHGETGQAYADYALERDVRGTWKIELPGLLYGTYYDYLVWNGGKSAVAADPYAVGCGCNSTRSLVVDLKATNPKGFDTDKAPALGTEQIIYELHIKDFSYDKGSGVPEAYRGKYKAFTVKNADGSDPVCIRHLKELGVTHVHLLPFYDYGSVDEAGDDAQFNWGYDPVNYNVPEGSYSTNPHDGYVRIRECKEMIQALHENGIRVVMDVVYNHTYSEDSCFNRMAPGYYYRKNADGSPSNGSACGNDVAAGRAMVDNYIAASVMYWAREYHLDGFRFDLMGLLTVELMNRIRKELDEEFGPGEKLLYGEPWRADASPMEDGTRAALKENVQYLSEGVAVFCDCTRDVIKGHVFYAKEKGFVNGEPGLESAVLKAVTGWQEGTEGFQPISCAQVINYVSAHDNYTLWDKLVLSMHESEAEQDFCTRYQDILDANKLAAFIYFTCQGNLFMQAGEEYGRTKLGDDNSYCSSAEINKMSWEHAKANRELVEYYKGLIALRKNLPGLCDKRVSAAKRISAKQIHAPGVVSFRVNNQSDAETEWAELFILYNAGDECCKISLPEGDWVILADKTESNCRKSIQDIQNIEAAAHGGLLLGRRAARNLEGTED